MYNDIKRPMLTEPGVKYFISETLKQCHLFKEQYQNYIFNVLLCVGFLFFLAGYLLYKYKGKLSPEEMKEKEDKKKEYILTKIKNYKLAKLRAQQSLITGLPHWDESIP